MLLAINNCQHVIQQMAHYLLSPTKVGFPSIRMLFLSDNLTQFVLMTWHVQKGVGCIFDYCTFLCMINDNFVICGAILIFFLFERIHYGGGPEIIKFYWFSHACTTKFHCKLIVEWFWWTFVIWYTFVYNDTKNGKNKTDFILRIKE